MESLEGCSTNVFKLDNLSQIPYVVYQPSSDCEAALRPFNLKSAEYQLRCRGKTVVADIETQEFWWFGVDLEPTEKQIEETGENKEPAAFSISADEENILSSLRLGAPSNRVLNAASLASSPSSSLVPPTPTPSINTNPSTPAGSQFPAGSALADLHAQQRGVNSGLSAVASPTSAVNDKSNGASQAGDSEPEQQIPHRRFIEAVVGILSFKLAKSKKWLPLNFCSFVSNMSIEAFANYKQAETSAGNLMTPPATPASANDNLHYSKPNMSPASITTFTVNLTTSGTLMIIPSTVQQKALRQLSTSGSSSIPQLTDIWLAPTGVIGRYVGAETDEDHLKWEKWKLLARKWMLEHGVEISDTAPWAKVQIYVPDEGLLEVIWPSHCIFYRATNHLINASKALPPGSASLKPPPSSTSLTGPDIAVDIAHAGGDLLITSKFKSGDNDLGLSWFDLEDSIAFAEEWVSGKQKREEEIKRRRDSRAAKLQQGLEGISKEGMSTNKTTDSGKDERKDSLTGLAGANPGGGGGGGVYPTPPDGVIGPGSHPTPAGPTSVPTPAPASKTPGEANFPETVESGPPTAPATAEQIATGPSTTEMDIDDNWMSNAGGSRNDQGQDMFGDLGGMGMGTDDGLEDDFFGGEVTEADFDDFFGEAPAQHGNSMGTIMESGTEGLGATSMTGGDMGSTSMEPSKSMQGGTFNTSLSTMDMGGFDGMSMEMYETDRLDMMDDNMDLDLDSMTAEMDMHTSGHPKDNSLQPQDPVSSAPATANDQKDQELSVESGVSDNNQNIVIHAPKDPMIEHIQTPPLSPHRAMKLLLPGSNTPKAPKQQQLPNGLPTTPPTMHRLSLYSPVAFSSLVERSDKKYQEGGRFFCPPEQVKNRENSIGDAATAVPPRPKSSHRPPSRKQDDFPDMADGRDLEMESLSEHSSEFSSSDADETSEDEFDAETGFEDDFGERGFHAINSSSRSSEFVTGRKRKRMSSDDWATHVEGMHRDERLGNPASGGVSLDALGDINVVAYERRSGLPPSPWALFQMDANDFPLSGIFLAEECKIDFASSLGSRDMAAVSKLVTEQLIWSSTDHFGPKTLGSFSKSKVSLTDTDAVQGVEDIQEIERTLLRKEVVRLEDDVGEVIKSIFGNSISKCTLAVYLKIADLVVEMPSLMGRRAIPMKPTPGGPSAAASMVAPGAMLSPGSSPSMFKIEPPHVHVHRNLLNSDCSLEILPPALHFWDTFGFSPHSGSKNVVAFCVHPASSSLSTSGNLMLDQLGAAYEGCRLGKFTRGSLDYASDGLLNFSPPKSASKETYLNDALAALDGLFVNLGQKLTEIEDKFQNVVIFFLNPFSHPSAFVEICHSFYKLQKAYLKSMQFQLPPRPNNIVLQCIPIHSVAVKDGVLPRAQGQLARLALEVYNRCTPTDPERYSDTFPQETYSPSVVLAQPPPKSIDFKLTPDPSPAILQENKCLHIAYSQSLDERWISVAWSDNWGEIKVLENYCLGRRDCQILRPFEDVCKDIWDKTISIISKKRVHWRLLLVKAGVMDKDEAELWTKFSTESPTPHALTMLSADISPALSLSAQLPAILPQHFNPQSMMYSTPGNTPGASTVSPDQFGSAGGPSTPSNDVVPDLDPDSTLLDYADETWGVILPHRIPNTESLVDFKYALASGYLIKRGGAADSDDPVLFGVNLIHCPNNGLPMSGNTLATAGNHLRVYENTLREILGHYRGLVTLAQHLNIIDTTRDVVPWHIAAAVKAQESLSILL